jgi:hypothetical protein
LRNQLIFCCREKLLLREVAGKISYLFGSPLFEWDDELLSLVGSEKCLNCPYDLFDCITT